MVETITILNDYAARWTDAMATVMWQSILLVGLVATILWMWRALPPAVRCWIWRIVAVKLLVMPFWTVNVPAPNWLVVAPPSARGIEAGAVISTPTTTPVNDVVSPTRAPGLNPAPPAAARPLPRLTWQVWLVVAWLAVIAIQLGRLVWQRVRLRQLLAESEPADDRVCQLAADGCSQLQLARVPELRITDVDVSPFVCRWVRPLLVLPRSMGEVEGNRSLGQIVLHELAHVRRHDLTWCWFAHTMRMVYWFHPVVHWVAFREALERELACDELAMAHSGATAADYARTLIEAASRAAQPAVLRAAAVARLNGGDSLGRTPATWP